MNILLKLLAPALLLGAVLLIGERPTDPPDELPAAEISAAQDEQALRSAPCPGLLAGSPVIALPPDRLPPAAAVCLAAGTRLPERRAHSPPFRA